MCICGRKEKTQWNTVLKTRSKTCFASLFLTLTGHLLSVWDVPGIFSEDIVKS